MHKRASTTIAFLALMAALISVLWNIAVTVWVGSKNEAQLATEQKRIATDHELAVAISDLAKAIGKDK